MILLQARGSQSFTPESDSMTAEQAAGYDTSTGTGFAVFHSGIDYCGRRMLSVTSITTW